MKTLIVFVLAVTVGISGYMIKVPVAPTFEATLAPSGWTHLQNLILPLFENVCEESSDPVISRLSVEFTTNLSAGDFWDPEVITKFQNLKSGKGFLPKGQIFSEYNSEHTDELNIIFDVMRNAKTFDKFYQVAAWSRQNLNCGLYVSLIYLALENRKDTEKLTLPPPYELLPNYFIRKDIIIQGSSLLAGEEFTPSEGVRDEGNAFTLDANYTANFYDNDDETKLAYFREDIGLNSYYFLMMLKQAPWLNKKVDINSRYGEDMYHMMKQLVARYNLERYSNGMPEQDNFNWDSLSDAPYDPMLVYSNGNEFIHRTSPVQLPENEDKALLKTIENNIATVVSHMRDAGYNKTQILNHLMEILVTGERSYDTLARRLLGKTLSNNGQPTVLEHYMTSLRDPMIWRLIKNIVDIVDEALSVLPSYTKSELYFPGVEVMSIDVKKMMTNYDYFEFDITEALKIGNGDTTFQVKIGQPRLNHKPFMMKLNISSFVSQKGLVKIYLGPKIMPGEFSKKKNLFYLLDCFELNIKKGFNIVARSSNEMKTFAPDFTSIRTLRKRVEDAQFGLDVLPLNAIDLQIGFPERLTIPRGIPEGLALQIFVFVAPLMKTAITGTFSSNIEFNPAALSPLYPLDLAMEDRFLFDLPNAFVKELLVTHKGVSKVSNYGGSGATKSWFDNNTAGGPPPRPNYNGNEPFDYKSKKGQFGQDVTTFHDNDQYYEDGESSMISQNYLKTTGINPLLKQKQPYEYISTRPQYAKPDYSSKRVDYKSLYKNKNTEEASQALNVTGNTIDDQQIMNPALLSMNTAKNDYENFDENVDLLENQMMNDGTPLRVTHNILQLSGSESTKKDNDSFDYKSIRPKLVKPDYKKIYKITRKTTEKPIDMEAKNKITKNIFVDKNNINISDNIEKKYTTAKIDLTKGDTKNNAPEVTTYGQNEDIFVKNVGSVDIFKTFDSSDVNSPNAVLNNIYDDIILKDKQGLEHENYFGIYIDDSNERFVKVVPVTKSSIPKTPNDEVIIDDNSYKTDYKDTKDDEFIKVVPVTNSQVSNMDDSSNSIYRYITRVIHKDVTDD